MSVNPVFSPGHHGAVDDVSGILESARSLIASNGYERPLLLLRTDQIRTNAQRFLAALPNVRPHFAVKSNPNKQVLRTLHQEGISFEIASVPELELLLEQSVSGEEIFYSNPIKSEAYLSKAMEHGVRWYAVDSVAEVQKIHRISEYFDTPVSLYLRLKISNSGSVWPLDKKFGVEGWGADDVLRECLVLNMDLAGVTFHVGSQCLNIDNWCLGIRAARQFFRKMKAHKLTPRLLNLGGGFPVCMNTDVPSIEKIGQHINRELLAVDPDIQVIAEPGRNLVASAGCMVTQVIGTAVREGQHWLYLDSGVYGGLMELNDRFHYPVITDRRGVMLNWTLAGPTCDSIDVCIKNQLLPANMQSGDLIYIPYTGAYTACCATEFNGFPTPDVIVI